MYIDVPCGHCSECIARRQLQVVQRVQMESLNNYLFFCTLTYNSSSLPSVVTSTGYDIKYADIRDIQLLFKRIRNNNLFTRPFKSLYVSELGKKKGRPHFHCLFFLPQYPADDKYTPYNLASKMYDAVLKNWVRNVGSKRKPKYIPLCTYARKYIRGKLFTNFDLHYVEPFVSDDGCSNVAFYVIKYMLKPSDRETRLQRALHLNLPEDEYNAVWNLVKTRCIWSKGFGLNLSPFGDPDTDIIDHIRKSVGLSEDYPKYINPSDGKMFPLSRFYRNRGDCYDMSDAIRFYFADNTDNIDSPVVRDISEIPTVDQLVKKQSDYEKKVKSVSDRGDADNYFNEFD